MESVRAQVAVLSVTGGTAVGVGMENVVADSLTRAGHQVSSFESVKNSEIAIRAQLVGWIEDPDIDLVIIVGDGHNITKALAPLIEQPLPGFADLLRMLAFQEIGASAMLSTAEAARCESTFVFVLPVGEAAVRAAMDKLILPQLDPNTQPKNLIAEMPRFREEGDFTRVDAEPAEAEAVPMAIVKERTVTGAGLIPRLPAKAADMIPDPVQRNRPPTQSRVKSATGRNVVKVEDPTKPIELQKLERQIELSKVTDSTRPMVRLPKLPPGATKEAAVTKISTTAERKPATVPRQPTPAVPIKIPRATPVTASPVVAKVAPKRQAMIVDEPEQMPAQLEARNQPPRTEEIEPLDAEELVETVERLPEQPPVEVVNLAALDPAVGITSGAHELGDSELEPVDDEDRETLERLLPPESVRPKHPPSQPPPEPKVARPPTEPPPRRAPTMPPPLPLPASSDLPAGSFDYSGHLKNSKPPLILGLLLVAGIAIGAVLVLKDRGGSSEVTKDAASVAVTPPTPDAAAIEPDATEEIEMEPVDAAVAQRPTKPTRPVTPSTPSTPSDPKPTDPKPTDPKPTDPETTDPKPADPKPDDPSDPGCDESSCVIEKYARPCCAKYKPTSETPTTGNSDSLEKPQIRAGIERVRPAISRCGEQHSAKGTVKIAVTVSPDGAVTGAEVVDAPSPDLGKCVAGFVRKATFAKTANGGSFSYPFVF